MKPDKNFYLAFLAAALFCAALPAETVDTGALKFTVRPDGGGFLDEVVLNGKSVATFADSAAHNPDFASSPEAAARAAELRKLCAAGGRESAPCKLSREKDKHGNEKVVMENGWLRVAVIPQIGGRVIEMTDLVTGLNHFAERYTTLDKLPDLSKRVFLGGFEDAIDRSDIAWKTPYAVKVTSESPDKLAVCFSADVENPGEGGKKVRIDRTLTLTRGSPVLAIALVYTALGGPQSVKMMPHPEPVAGPPAGGNDSFYVSSHGVVVRHQVKGAAGGDIFVPLDERDNDRWGAICDAAGRNTIVHTFQGPMAMLDIYIPGDGSNYSFEPYTRNIENMADGQALSLNLSYWCCYNLDAVQYAEPDFAAQLLPEKSLFFEGEALAAKTAWVSAEKSERIKVQPRIVAAGNRVARELDAFTVESKVRVAEPEVKKFELGDLPSGAYTLVFQIQREGKPDAFVRAPFNRCVRRGCALDWFAPAQNDGPAQYAVLGKVVSTAPKIKSVKRQDAGDILGIEIQGVFKTAEKGPETAFKTLLTAEKGSSAIAVEHTLLPPLPAGQLSNWSLVLPLNPVLGAKLLKITAGNDNRFPDIWRLDNTGEYYWGWLLSGKMHWPLWRLGGLLVDSPTHYRIWKANRQDTSAVTTYEGSRSPGWLDVSDGNDWGVTVVFPDDVMRQAPKGITFDAENKLLAVALQPPETAPLWVEDQAKPLTARFRLEFHPTRHPTRFPPELTDEQYAKLLDSVKAHWTFGANLLISAGLNPEGRAKDELVKSLVLADMPPSAVLRMEGSFLKAVMQALGKDFVPNNADTEDNIRRILHYYRTGEKQPPGSEPKLIKD